ncbi:MAG: type IV pilus twitching motility protein PilT [Candidatus Firestonebacteria bacterium]
MKIKDLLQLCIDKKASDLIITANTPPILRKDGEVIRADHEALTPAKTKELIEELLSVANKEAFVKEKELDFSFEFPGVSRFRVNVYLQKSTMAATFRAVPLEVPTLASLGLPPVLKEIAAMPRGLVLVTGPAGCGKSSTLAAIINHINKTRKCHIITIEDPIEFIHKNLESIIEQRELNIDTDSFVGALKHVVRQSPDVILVGEMRDLETITTAVTAAETGHLVLGTLHTIDAPQSVSRIVDVFPTGQQEQIRTQFAGSLLAVISQQLLPRKDGEGRVPAVEVLINTPGIRAQIMHNDIHQIPLHIHTGRDVGMISMNRSLKALVDKGIVDLEVAANRSYSPTEFKRLFLRYSSYKAKNARAMFAGLLKLMFRRKFLLFLSIKYSMYKSRQET